MHHLYIGASSLMKIRKVSAGLVQLFIAFHVGSLVMGDVPTSNKKVPLDPKNPHMKKWMIWLG
jgi:hypothetical protein